MYARASLEMNNKDINGVHNILGGGLLNFIFEMGSKHKYIKSVLASKHSIHISERRHLRRLLNARGHSSHTGYCDLAAPE